jgi:hypothetical protein
MLPLAVNVLALMTLALPILPPEPVVLILFAEILPDAINVFALITLALVMLPPLPLVTKLPKLALPVAFNVPAILTPVPVTINILALPTALILTLPFAAGIFTLLLPFDNPAVVIPVRYIPLPVKKLADTLLPKLALPDVILPVTAKLLNVPTLVMFGCAAVVTVPAVVALVALLAVP